MNNTTSKLKKPDGINTHVSGSLIGRLFWAVKCHKCGYNFCETENEYDLFISKSEALQIIKDSGWQIKRGNICVCPDCR